MKPFKPICLAFMLLSWLPAGAQVVIDPSAVVGAIKPMNAVNNGPAVANAKEQTRGNFYEYKVLNIPYARTHDSAYYAGYGGPHCVDISQLFPDFDKNPNDPSAYDFTNTDAYLTEAFNTHQDYTFYPYALAADSANALKALAYSDAATTNAEVAYRSFAASNYLGVSAEEKAYFDTIIASENLSADIDGMLAAAAYIEGAAEYDIEYVEGGSKSYPEGENEILGPKLTSITSVGLSSMPLQPAATATPATQATITTTRISSSKISSSLRMPKTQPSRRSTMLAKR